MRITQQEGATGSGRTFWLPLTFGKSHVESDNIGGFRCKLWISADTPASLPRQTNVLFTKATPSPLEW
jgi:hypothetical protein